MKKLVLASALVLGCFTMTASVVSNVNDNIANVVLQDNFTEISAESVPQAVKDAVNTDYAGATIDKAYVNENNVYKLEISLDGTSSTLYANEEGEWITQ